MPEKNSTNFLRVLAIVLVINSHMDSLYPPQVAFLATGGMMGNALFFMLSACGLLVSMRARPRAFGEWYARRIIRIYPPVWLTVVLLSFPIGIYVGSIRLDNILEEMSKFFYPPFWFLQALLIYYAIIFFIIRDFSYKRLALVSIPTVTIYVLYYIFLLDLAKWSIEQTPFKLIYYFLVVLWGVYLGSQSERLQFRGPRDVVLLILSVSFIYGHKYLMQRGLLLSYQFVQHLASFPMLYFAVKVAKSSFIRHTIMDNRYAGKALTFVSGATLELFIVNNSSIGFLGPKLGAFPFNVLALVLLNSGLALLIFYCAQPIRRTLESHASVAQDRNIITDLAATWR
jgi:peptidoglycan/LPS O-acetylase OafA/YrhL